MDRETVGAWLSGPREALAQQGIDMGYPGQRLGMPESGPGSVARFGRRLVALFIDWFACLAVAEAVASSAHARSVVNLELFFAEVALLTALTGASFGQRLAGIAVRRLDGGRVDALRVAVRTVLLCLAVPALIWDRDNRGVHDQAVGSVVVRT